MEEQPLKPSLEDKFMKMFKYYKSKTPKPLLKDLLTVEKCSTEVYLYPYLYHSNNYYK